MFNNPVFVDRRTEENILSFHGLFNWNGRRNRLNYFLMFLGLNLVLPWAASFGPLAGLCVALLMCWIGLVNSCKRGHDIGLSAFWVIIASFLPYLVVIGFGVALVVDERLVKELAQQLSGVVWACLVISFVFFLMGFQLYLFLKKGTTGNNPYGEDLLENPYAELLQTQRYKVCNKCMLKYKDELNFCPKCGNKLSDL